nr:putative leucine-rich repeat receptor-like protein kinase [Quercus suber]
MGGRTGTQLFLLLLLFMQYLFIALTANDASNEDFKGLLSLQDELKNTPNWKGSADPCDNWEGISGDRVLRNNWLNGTLDVGTAYSNQLQLIDLQNNSIENFTGSGIRYNKKLMVHHKNLISLVVFCFDQGKLGFRLDWTRRLKITLGTARGLAYLHELANPPIIHRDIKSTNILLDEHLNAKVSDFGLSKPMGEGEKGHVSTQVKGTMGYMDLEYYMTQQLTEKSDVYNFGVVMLELITTRMPIERRKYIVRVVQTEIDRTKDLYNLQEILDPTIGLQTSLKGLEKFVYLAMRCFEESESNKSTMGDMVKEIEDIMQMVVVSF